jgi:hypothetical protein
MERPDGADEREREEEALSRDEREGLVGDTAKNRNLSGSSTWETLPDQEDSTDEVSDELSEDDEG